MMYQPVDSSSEVQHKVVPSCSTFCVSTFDCDDVALKQEKKQRKVTNIDLQSDVPVHEKKNAPVAPCEVDTSYNRAFTAEELNIQLRDNSNKRHTPHFNIHEYDTFKTGFTVFGTRHAVMNLLDAKLESLGVKTGVIIDEAILPSDKCQFTEKEDFSVEKPLGKGNFGVVSLCRHSTTNKHFVRKKIFENFHRKEAEVLMQLHHRNITRFLGFIVEKNKAVILMEYAGMSLKAVMECEDLKKILTPENISNLAHQGYEGLAYMHGYDILHLDIKPENVCITTNPLQLKITDFGSSKTPQEPISIVGWTPEYMSPEACKLAISEKMPNENITIQLSGKTDVFGFALTVVFMLYGCHILQEIIMKYLMPEADRKDASKYAEARTKILLFSLVDVNFVKNNAISDAWDGNIKHFLDNTLEGEVEKRWTSMEARDYFSGVIKQYAPLLPTIIDSPPPTSSPGSPSSDSGGNSPFFNELKSSFSNGNIWPTGDNDAPGKMVKKHLRLMIKKRSTSQPYTIQERHKSPASPVLQTGLPDFNQLMA